MGLAHTSALIFGSLLGLRKIKTRPCTETRNENASVTHSIYDLKLKSLDGKEISLADFKGKKMLIVNTAAKCGFTAQLEQLQKLNEEFADNLVILGFPSDDFGKQELNNNYEIQQFCTRNYGVTFQLFEKSFVSGKNSNILFEWLSNKEKNGWNHQQPNWNFCKYVVNENGELTNYFSSAISPLSNEIRNVIRN